MTHFKAEEEKKREELTLQITNQKTQIADKENQSKNKNESISQMETEFQEKLKELNSQLSTERTKKANLDKELA